MLSGEFPIPLSMFVAEESRAITASRRIKCIPITDKMHMKPHRQRVYEKLPDKAANLIKVIVLSIIAVFVGIQFGNLVSS